MRQANEESKTIIDIRAISKESNSQLPKVVWSSFASNMINIFDLRSNQLYKPFKGAQVKAGSKKSNIFILVTDVHYFQTECFTFVENMPDTDILLSAHYSWNGFEGNFESFRVGKKVEKIYSLEGFERRGRKITIIYSKLTAVMQIEVGTGDIACNAARKVAALIPVEHVAEYHLFDWTELKIKKIAKYQPIHKG